MFERRGVCRFVFTGCKEAKKTRFLCGSLTFFAKDTISKGSEIGYHKSGRAKAEKTAASASLTGFR